MVNAIDYPNNFEAEVKVAAAILYEFAKGRFTIFFSNSRVFRAVMETLKKNPYGLNLLNSSFSDIENYVTTDTDGKSLLQFVESCYNNILKSYAETIAQYR